MPKKKFTSVTTAKSNGPRGILELDRFTDANITQWNAASENLNELEDVLYFNLEPERRRLRSELIKSLSSQTAIELDIQNWTRIISYQYSAEPLSCIGSLKSYGGRFNAGCELDSGTLVPWAALYIAENYETAFREKRQLAYTDLVEGLTPSELALQPGENLTSISLDGKLYQVFDMRSYSSLASITKVLKKIKMPERAKVLQRKLKIAHKDLFMIQTAKQLHDAICKSNWRVLPTQFGLPSQSHIIAELIKSAGFEAILYPSSKGPGNCLSIFPDALTDHSYLEILGNIPDNIHRRRLDTTTASSLMSEIDPVATKGL